MRRVGRSVTLPAGRRGGNRRGAALVEFGLVALVAYVLVAGGVELGRMIFVSQALQDASRVAARELAVTPLPASDSFAAALGEPDVMARIWNPNLLVIDLTCANYDDAGLEAYWASLPVVNRALRPVFISESVDLGVNGTRHIMRYPGALLKLTAAPANPCPGTYDPATSTDNPTDLSVAIPRVTYDPGTGQESGYVMVPIVAEVRCDPGGPDAYSPFSLAGVPPPPPSPCAGIAFSPGIIALAINYPFQSAALSFFHRNPAGPLEPDISNPIVADDTAAAAGAPALPPGTDYANPDAGGPGLYNGVLGLGTQFALAQRVRPYRSLITGQAIYRREVFQ